MPKINKSFFKKYYPRRSKDSYKNLNGKLFIVAGSKDMPGAAVLAARSAYRAGAGFVTIAAPQELRLGLINAVPEALILDIKSKGGYLNAGSLKQIKAYIKGNPQDAMLIGCGLGKSADITLDLLKSVKIPAVVDADALNFIAAQGLQKLPKTPLILTPHVGEMKRLLGKLPFDKDSAALTVSELTGAICLLKGPCTQICFNGIKHINTSGNEGLSKAGSGDVLAGIIAALWVRLIKADNILEKDLTASGKGFLAAALGTFLHGAAADDAVVNISKEALLASDIIDVVPYTLKKLLG